MAADRQPIGDRPCVALTLWAESQSTGGAGLVALCALISSPLINRHHLHARNVIAAGLLVATAGVFAEQTLRRGRCVLADAPRWRATRRSTPPCRASVPRHRE
jgi:hypothetical protein